MTEIDFSEIVSGDDGQESSTTSNSGGTTGQVHIKRRYGTKTIHANQGCHACHMNADVAVKMEDPSNRWEGMDVKVTLCCFDHLGEVTEGLVRSPFDFELVGFE